MEQAKQAMLAENMDFSEQQEPSARSGAGMPSLSGFIEQHFDFAQADPDLEYLHKQLKSALKGRDSGRKNSSQTRVDGLRAQIKKKLKLNDIAKKDALSMATDLEVYNDPRGGSNSEYAEEGDTQDFTTCQRPDGSKYGSNGRCIKGSETSPASKDDKKSSSTSSGGGGAVGSNTKSLQSEARSLDKKAKAADKKADAADKKFQKSKSPADQKAAKAADKEAKAANKAADKADKNFKKSAAIDKKIASINTRMKSAKTDEQKRKLSRQRADLSEAQNKLRYSGSGTGQSKLTGSQVRAAAGTVD